MSFFGRCRAYGMPKTPHEYLEEDCGPERLAAEELRGGHFVTAHPRNGLDISFDAAAVTGPDRDRLWAEVDHGVEPQDRK
jgi:hypothetical protein